MTARRLPSVKTLAQCFDDAKRARAIFEMSRGQLLDCAELAHADDAWCANAKTWQLRLTALDTCGRFHGIECCEAARTGEYAEYLNAGDTYAPTVIYWRDRYRVQCLGDFIERVGVQFK